MNLLARAAACAVLLCLALPSGVISTFAASDRDRDLCLRWRGDKSPFDRRISSCTVLIQDGRRGWKRNSGDFTDLYEGLLSRCHAYRYQERYELAQKDCADAFDSFTAGVRVWGNSYNRHWHSLYAARGALLSSMGRYREALKDEDEAVNSLTSADGSYAYIFSNRGLTYVALKQYDRALEDFDQAIALDDRFLPAFVNRGREYARRGSVAQAKADLTRALSLPAADYDFGRDLHDSARRQLKILASK